MAFSLLERSSRGSLCKIYSLEGKERGRGQSKRRSQKTKACGRGGEEKKIVVHLITLG